VEHVVFFPAPDGTPAFRRLATLDDAARFVEHLRNVENVSEASVHTLTEVPLSFKAWYRVELPPSETVLPEAQPANGVAESQSPVLEIPAPTTIAEVIESYSQDASSHVELPESGSATGIIVPERELASSYAFASAAPATAPAQAQVPVEQAAYSQPSPDSDAQVLQPAFGVRRDRGIGYFAR
jgi:hypothetical protein